MPTGGVAPVYYGSGRMPECSCWIGAGQRSRSERPAPGAMRKCARPSLPLVFTLANFFKHSEACLFCVRNGKRLQLVRRAEAGNNLAHGLPATRALRQLRRAQWPPKGEPPSAYFALSPAQFVFIERHKFNFVRPALCVEPFSTRISSRFFIRRQRLLSLKLNSSLAGRLLECLHAHGDLSRQF